MIGAGAYAIPCAVEGDPDEAVLRRLAEQEGLSLGTCYGKKGRQYLRDRIHGFNQAARQYPWIVLVDLEKDNCAPDLRAKWLPDPATYMCFRVAVREIEAWLLADSENLAKFLGVNVSLIPSYPERENDPKQKMIELARRSRRKDIREDMVPRAGSGRETGPAYNSRLIEFVWKSWAPEVAAHRSDSLRRCIQRIRELPVAFSSKGRYV